jgi:plastocyanin
VPDASLELSRTIVFSQAMTCIIQRMRFRAALAPVAIAVASAAVLASCGGGSDSGSTGTTIPADVTVVAVEGIAWDAKDYTATAGEISIAAVNRSSLPHNLHIVDPSGTQLPQVWDIPSRGDAVNDTITLSAGTYTLICTIPGHANMKSTLTVS